MVVSVRARTAASAGGLALCLRAARVGHFVVTAPKVIAFGMSDELLFVVTAAGIRPASGSLARSSALLASYGATRIVGLGLLAVSPERQTSAHARAHVLTRRRATGERQKTHQ